VATSVKMGSWIRQGCCLPLISIEVYREYITKEAIEGFEDFKIGGQVIHSVKYSDDLMVLAKKWYYST
jgi:hypothetical protein